LNLARRIPGKNEFNEMLRYYRVALQRAGVTLRLRTSVTADDLADGGFDEVVLATGVLPRTPDIPGIDHPKVLGYVDVLARRADVGRRVAILGAGGIGFDVAEFLSGDPQESLDPAAFQRAWGVDASIAAAGGLAPPAEHAPLRSIHMFQRKAQSLGRNLGKSTGWILKAKLRKADVAMTAGVRYEAIDDRGLHYTVDGQQQVLEVDHVIVCTGQESNRSLYQALQARGMEAQRAIDQATRLAVSF
jgi:2,4-dienoyl-CoA reductase (NADPH2)